jgi:DNA-binding response OmpR family regulator
MRPSRSGVRAADGAARLVLVVEDDASIAMGLQINLEAEGYRVVTADDGERGLEAARTLLPDLIILDIMLPRLNGLEIVQALRRGGFRMPIIILSARTGEIDKVTGLELGAEDYVAKPFSLAELLARVRAALRRANGLGYEREAFTFGDVVVDVTARKVHKAGVLVDVTATEFDILYCLIKARGQALSRQAIFERVWGPNHHGTPRTIDNFMQQLRSKLEEDPQDPRHFMTVRGIGYRFEN